MDKQQNSWRQFNLIYFYYCVMIVNWLNGMMMANT